MDKKYLAILIIPLAFILFGIAYSVTNYYSGGQTVISTYSVSTPQVLSDSLSTNYAYVGDNLKVRDENITKECDVVVARNPNEAADIYCLDNDCSDEIQKAIDIVASRGGGTVCIREGEYPIATSIHFNFNSNADYIGIIGLGKVRLYATTDAVDILHIGPDNPNKTVKYYIKNLWIDMNNLADEGLVLINPENSIIEDVIISNRDNNGRHWMLDLWCRRNDNDIRGDFCKNNILRNIKIVNSTATNWEAMTLTGLENTIVENVYCINVTFRCIVGYRSIKTYYNNIIGNYSSPYYIITENTYDVKIENVYAPNGKIQIGYAWSPFTENYIIIRNSLVRSIENWPNSGICIPGIGERPWWCDIYGPYIAHPKLYIENVRIINPKQGISIRIGCYNSTYRFSYPELIVFKNSYIETGWGNSIAAKYIIFENNIARNVSYNAGGYRRVIQLFCSKCYVKDNVAYGQYPDSAYFYLYENGTYTCSSGEIVTVNPNTVFGTNATIVFKDNYGEIGTTTLYKYIDNGVIYAINQTTYYTVKDYNNVVELWS